MCRAGGRRCPGEHDPAVKAARNAKRRAKYAADKAAGKIVSKKKKKATKTVNNVETVDNSTVTNNSSKVSRKDKDRRNPTLDTKMEREEKLLNETSIPEVPEIIKSTNQKLGIRVSENKDAENLDRLYSKTTVRGKINYNNLDNESYKEFGLSLPTDAEYFDNDINSLEMSKNDLKDMTPDQRHALWAYSGAAYYWINKNTYHPESISDMKKRAGVPDEDGNIVGKTADQIYEEKAYMTSNSTTVELLKKTTEELDNVLSQGQKHQRVVYRGISGEEIKGNVHDWIKSNRSIGTEIVFNGYTSTTLKPRITGAFLESHDSVVYQILTPEGAAIKSASSHDHEEEVLLPRNQRYMVVGVHEDARFGFSTANIVQLVAINSKGEILDGTNSDPIDPLITDDMLEDN